MSRFTRRARDLPLFWKLLVPFLVLLVVVGTVGTFVVVRGMSARANDALNRDLTENSLAARSRVHDRELYVLESGTFAANLEGVGQATMAKDADALRALMESVLALKTDLTLVAVLDENGNAIVQFSRTEPGAAPVVDAPVSWASSSVVATVLGSTNASTHAELSGFGDHPLIVLATTVCEGREVCQPVGAIVVGVDAARVVSEARNASDANRAAGVAVYNRNRQLVAASGRAPTTDDLRLDDRFARHRTKVSGREVAALYSPLDLQGDRAGWLSVWVPTRGAFGGVRSAAIRLGLILFAAMLGIVAIGAGLSRFVLAQVRPLVDTNRALAAGDLTARAPVLGRDELGELAAGVNQMADALQQSHETLEARVEERTVDVERLLRERTDFFTAMSHEFRTPLAVILGQAEMLGDPGFEKKAAWHNQSSRVVSDAARQLLDFVNDILEIAKSESGHIELQIEDVRVDTVLRDLRPVVERLAATGDIRASVRVPRKLPMVRADAARLRQVVLDLVDNAVKYTPAGGTVRVVAADKGDAVEISVADTGVGIPPAEAGRVFEPFYRVTTTTTQRGQPSSGLGLALVKRLVEAQGGSVRLESSEGVGTTFTVTVPLANSIRGVA